MSSLSRIQQVEHLYLRKLWEFQTTDDHQAGYNDTVVKTLRVVLKTLGRPLPKLDIVECRRPECSTKFRYRKGKRYCSASCRSRDWKRISSS